jgi:hypothetical protein
LNGSYLGSSLHNAPAYDKSACNKHQDDEDRWAYRKFRDGLGYCEVHTTRRYVRCAADVSERRIVAWANVREVGYAKPHINTIGTACAVRSSFDVEQVMRDTATGISVEVDSDFL